MESSGESLIACAQNLEKMLGKKNTFEEAAKKLTILMEQEFSSASEQEQRSLYSAVCRAASLLKARYTSRGFWALGERLFEASGRVVAEREQVVQVQKSLREAQQFLGDIRAQDEAAPDQGVVHRPESFHFEGQLTSGAPPPQPAWLLAQQAVFAAIAQEQALPPSPPPPSRAPPNPPPTRPPPPIPAAQPPTEATQQSRTATEPLETGVPGEAPEGGAGGGEQGGEGGTGGGEQGPPGQGSSEVDPRAEVHSHLARVLSLLRANASSVLDFADGERLEEALQASLLEAPASYNARPPASKAEVEKLPVIEVSEEWLAKETEGGAAAPRCTICLEDLAVGDGLQELPCKHRFHPSCIREWFSSRNSCPLCMNELPTDDAEYERAKVRAREDAEERRGMENAVREGEFMYI